MSIIILRDIPKQSAQLDLMVHQIQGGFRGFRDVPVGLHYVAIPNSNGWSDFWCYLQPDTVVVKKWDSDLEQLLSDNSEEAAHYIQLAEQHAMDAALQPCIEDQERGWRSLTQYISSPISTLQSLPNSLQEATDKSRFEHIFLDHHRGNVAPFLEDFQFAFLTWFMAMYHGPNEAASQRWFQLLNAVYNAGEHQISQHSHLFDRLVDVLLAQFAQLPSQWFGSESIICTQLDYLIEDMSDTENTALQGQAQALQNYVQQRQQEA